MSKTPHYGKTIDTEYLDTDGSSLSVETNYQKGVVRLPKFRHYEYRVRVKDAREEMTEYLRFCEEKVGKKNTDFRTEETQQGKAEGWYYVIKAWTEVIE